MKKTCRLSSWRTVNKIKESSQFNKYNSQIVRTEINRHDEIWDNLKKIINN